MLSDKSMEFGEQLTGALLGLDALYAVEQGLDAGESGGIDRLVVLNMSANHRSDAFSSYEAAIDQFERLSELAGGLPEPDRRVYYRETCESAIAFAVWRSRGLPFAEQLIRFLHVPAEPASDSDLGALQTALEAQLRSLGYRGDLKERVAAWEERHRVPPEDVASVLTDLLSDAWDETERVMEIRSDKRDGMNVEIVSGVPYNAMCDYRHRLIRLNIDPVLTVQGLRHLAVHEGYPGHYVQFKHREVAYADGLGPADNLLSVVNTASSAPFEGIADTGLALIGWQDTPDELVSMLLIQHNAAVGTRGAWRMHADGWSAEAVRDEMLRTGLSGGEGWVDSRIKFIAAHDRAALIWSYWTGDPAVRSVLDRVRFDKEKQARYIDWIYQRMHSLSSIAMLDA